MRRPLLLLTAAIVTLFAELAVAQTDSPSRQLHDVNSTKVEEEVVFVPLPPKRQYPVQVGAMVGGIFVGGLGVPCLYALWVFHEKNFKRYGGAFAELGSRE
eukprot:TRINITY_DN17025_c0_g1_i2.p1 TRINITY_DN17025_c0_g1~~TRINITY_DN17025_c0_g1_i2.p1  ORF type:complete len:115 (+),score=11.76 TRINITY_DN17025_c0_g1_i2:44-346(+)